MTTLFHSDFEDSSGTIVVPSGATGWTVPTGQYLVFDASVVSLTAVNGNRIMASSDAPDKATYTASGALAGQAVRHATKWQSHASPQVSGHLLRYESLSKYYFVYPETDGTSLRLRVVLYDGASIELAVSSYVLTCSVGDVIHHESKMVGTTIESRIWKNSEARPATATVSVVDTNIASGYPGLVKVGAGGTYAAVDQLVITDGAGGEDYFYPDTGPVTPSLVVSDGAHAHASDNLALTIIGTLSVADAAHAHTADSITLTATSNGTITIPAVRDWGTKALKVGQTGVQVDIRNIATGALVVRKTGQTTHATTGVCVVTDAAIVAGTTYEVVTRFADGSRGMWDYTAS